MVIEQRRRKDELDNPVIEIQRDPLAIISQAGYLQMGHLPDRLTVEQSDRTEAAVATGKNLGAGFSLSGTPMLSSNPCAAMISSASSGP
jgi:hypothetical protein